MRIEQLAPAADRKTRFAWSHHVTVPKTPGCYALATYNGDVLYVGLATKSIQDRMGKHLDTEGKLRGTECGVPFWFYYIIITDSAVAPVERGWMNQAILEDGQMPPLNKVYGPLD